ncbi:FHIPEP family type III secretion protein [Aquabacterium sp.]|uniref:FHIPEP family type III secretion protein n=1 Tax=Aquabacterium sp. TaxID=1872578 RepID=UPI002CA800A5|nr:FHIPEP family type III secretion protein [Aquabacterium sp.]HSW05258.1 FHIPEP family type III secretion protein [Aquabacterium sp.]
MTMSSYFRSAGAVHESAFARYSDLVLVAGVISIVAMMILPLPAWLIDLLVAFNIASGVVLLLLGIYIASPLEFSVFPSVLLMTTLFRLSLSIATTRMILLEGHAGAIIDTFGKVVAGGNLVVGLVVFLIITVVQFIVVAKGAERVAEVAARFSLDAMPGKQLSIDSDLRSGLIDKDEARRRRRSLELESKLHGSLDGAMKFVKGDTIAGIIIIVINLLGGLAIGVMMQDMDVGAALTKYAILTVGEGMVAQIPALLAAMAAGLIVTRTTDDETDKHLGDAIRKQIAAKPRVLLVAGGICVLMAVVPGFPAAAFLMLALASAGAGLLLTPACRERLRQLRHPAARGLVRRLETPQQVTATALPPSRPSVPLLLRVPSALLASQRAATLTHTLEEVLDEFQLGLGLTLPRIHVHGQPGAAAQDRWELLAYEVPIAHGQMPADDPHRALGEPVRQALRRHASLFLGVQDTTNLLTRASADAPDVVKEVLRALPVQRVADVLRRLVGESVSIRNLRDILEALSEAGQRDKDVHALTEFARIALRRQISHQAAPDGLLTAVLLEPALEDLLRQAVRVSSGVAQLALDPDMARRISEAVRSSIAQRAPKAIVTAIDVRWHLRKLIEPECFDMPVLSYHELMPTLQLEVFDRIAAPGAMLEAA